MLVPIAAAQSKLPRTSDRAANRDQARPFGPRLARAVALLMIAIAAHVWVVGRPRPFTPDLPILIPAFTSAAGQLSSGPVRTVANVAQQSVSAASGVSLRVDVVHALPSSALEGTMLRSAHAETQLIPVATTGVIAANDVKPVDDERLPDLAPVPARLPDISEPAITAAVLTRPAPPRQDTPLAYLSRPTPRVPAVELPDPKADLRKQEQVVLQVLSQYASAYDRMDVQAAKALRPSLDDRALQKAFQRLEGQQLLLASCGVSITGSNANARCRGNATYRPKVGSRVLHDTEREWTFNLSRGESGWQIVNTTVQ